MSGLEDEDVVLGRDEELPRKTFDSRQLANGLSSLVNVSSNMDIEVGISRAKKLSFDRLTSLGAGFSSLPEAMRKVTSTTEVAGEQLLTVTDKAGHPLDVSVLHTATDGSGIIGSFHDASDHLNQARFHVASPQVATVTTTVPFDPTTLFMAAALMEVNKKLDGIQETQRQMFDYLKDRDRAKLRGDLDTLRDVLDNYRFNWNVDTYKHNKHALVQAMRNDAEVSIVQQRAEIRKTLAIDTGPIHIDQITRDKTAKVLSGLKEYRLSVYLYGFSSFLEVLLLENFDRGYLANVVDKIENRSNDYRVLYTDAYNFLEGDANSSVRATLFGGVSGAMNALGKAIRATPIGDVTPIDEALIGAGKDVDDFNRGINADIMHDLPAASVSDTKPFVEGVEGLSHLYNDKGMILADEDTIYILPVDAVSVIRG